jgi:hypothetical protein
METTVSCDGDDRAYINGNAELRAMSSNEPLTVRSNWWWTHVAVVLWTLVIDVFILTGDRLNLSETIVFLLLQSWLFVFLMFSIAAMFGFYYDARAIRDAGKEWDPRWRAYVLASFLVTPAVTSTVYLFQRYRHIGIYYRGRRIGPWG